MDGAAARASGTLCERSGSSDVIDASVAVTAAGLAGHERILILTSDPDDIATLASALGAQVTVVKV